jgi:hypothetical protein
MVETAPGSKGDRITRSVTGVVKEKENKKLIKPTKVVFAEK